MRKVIWLLINNIHEKINGRSVTGSKGSCLLCWMFGNSLDNLGKSTRVQKKPFQQVSKIFENLRKSSKKIGKCRKVLKTTFLWNIRKISEICLKVLKITFQHFWIFLKSSEIVEIFRKKSENVRKFSKRSSDTLKIFGSVRKCSETLRKILNVIGGLWNFFILFQSLTPVDWRSDSRILICNLHWYYAFCTQSGVTL